MRDILFQIPHSLDQESIDKIAELSEDLLARGSNLIITSHQNNALTALCKKQWWIKENTLLESPHITNRKTDKLRVYLCLNQTQLVG